jgi:heme exporter protein CcmD
MGGYGAFIWSAYGVAAAVMLGLLVMSISASRTQQRELAKLESIGVSRRRQTKSPKSTEAGDDTQAS